MFSFIFEHDMLKNRGKQARSRDFTTLLTAKRRVVSGGGSGSPCGAPTARGQHESRHTRSSRACVGAPAFWRRAGFARKRATGDWEACGAEPTMFFLSLLDAHQWGIMRTCDLENNARTCCSMLTPSTAGNAQPVNAISVCPVWWKSTCSRSLPCRRARIIGPRRCNRWRGLVTGVMTTSAANTHEHPDRRQCRDAQCP